MDKQDLRQLMGRIADLDPDVVFHEPINPRGGNFEMTVAAAEEAGLETLAKSLADIQYEDAWVPYACQHFRWVQELAVEMDIPINLWPDDDLLRLVDDGSERERWLAQWRVRQSPEDFASRPDPDGASPDLPHSETEQGKPAVQTND